MKNPVGSGVTGGGRGMGRVPPRDFWQGNFCWHIRKRVARKRGKMDHKEKKTKKGKGGKLKKGRRKSSKKRWWSVFFFVLFCFVFVFCCFCFCFCFFAFNFSKRLKFILGLPKWEFSTGKKHFTPGKKSGKMTLPPQKNMPVMLLPVGSCRTISQKLIKVLQFHLSFMPWGEQHLNQNFA